MVGHSTAVRWGSIAVLLGAAVLAALLAAGPVYGAGGGAPLAEAGLDQQVRSGETVRLDATGSSDPDGHVTAFEWTVRAPDGATTPPQDPRSAHTSFRPTAVGRYEVTLTVTDGEGNTATDTMYVVVEPGDDGGGGRGGPGAGTPAPSGPRSSGGGGGGAGCSGGGSTSVCPGARGAPVAAPSVRIDGPTVAKAGHSYTYTVDADGLSGGRRYDWDGGDTGRRHTLVFETGGRYTTRVTAEDGRGRSASATLDVVVEAVENERPDVEIADPGHVSPGQDLRLSVEASDPDGRVVTTSWSPSRRVTVPTDGSSRTVRVTVTDDDGASVTDSITVSGVGWNRTRVGNDTTDVTCYFTQERQRDGRNPNSDRCIVENGNTASLVNGPSTIESYRRNEKVDLHWRRTTRERLRGLDANDTSTDYGVAAKSPHDEADRFGQSDDPVRMYSSAQWARVDNTEWFSLNDRGVEDDIDGDGEVNAADWDLVYRTDDDADDDTHADAAAAFRDAVHGGDAPGANADDEPVRRATARTVEGTFAGTSIDADVRRDRVAAYSRRASSGPGPGDTNDDGSSDSGDSDDSDDDTGSKRGTTTGEMNHVNHTNDDDDDGADGGGESHRTGGSGGDGGDSGGSGTDGPSRHSPHGGRIVVLP